MLKDGLKQILITFVEKILDSTFYDRIAQVRVETLNRRYLAIQEIADYLTGAQINGDYIEFGVFKGNTFAYACNRFSNLFPGMKFVACDSFEGLPDITGIDKTDGYSSNFSKNEFSCDENVFIRNLKRKGVKMDKVTIIKGWFSETLTEKTGKKIYPSQVAIAWIDCDLYESTVPVLNFLSSRISPGSVIVFDDWRCYRNNPNFGEQLACSEWLKNNPQIKLSELFSFGWHGIAFTVISC